MKKIRLKIKWLDPFTIITLPFLILIPFVVMSSMIVYAQRRSFVSFILILIVLILFLVWIRLLKHIDDNDNNYPAMLLENKHNGNVKVRLANGELRCIKKTDQYPIAIQGINTFIKQDKAYKVINGTNLKVCKDCRIKEYSLISSLVNKWVSVNDLSSDWKELNNPCE